MGKVRINQRLHDFEFEIQIMTGLYVFNDQFQRSFIARSTDEYFVFNFFHQGRKIQSKITHFCHVA